MNPHRIANRYLKHYADRDNPLLSKAWGLVNGLVHRKPKKGWAVILALVEQSSSEDALSYVAAGPLEDLIHLHGAVFIDQIEEAARNNPRMRQCLRSVWPSVSGNLLERLRKAAQ